MFAPKSNSGCEQIDKCGGRYANTLNYQLNVTTPDCGIKHLWSTQPKK